MIRNSAVMAMILAATQLIGLSAWAGQSCTDWMDQGNGTSWATCVDENGTQTCWLINNTPGSTAYQVSCSG